MSNVSKIDLSKSVNLFQGDCLEVMKGIPDGSVDLILTDPPFQTTANSWDIAINSELMWKEINRVVKKNGAVLLFGSEPFSTKLRMGNFSNYKYDIYWLKNKVTGFTQAKNKPMKNLELISVFSDGTTVHKSQSKNRMTYNPQGLVPINKVMKNGKGKFGNIAGERPSHKEQYVQEWTNYPKMTVDFECEHGLHPTQKPVTLLEYLIRTYTNEGETVLDFTCGSGSTGVAAVNTNRKFIGIELDENYFNIAEARIKETEQKLENLRIGLEYLSKGAKTK